jgi:hypothetical protein
LLRGVASNATPPPLFDNDDENSMISQKIPVMTRDTAALADTHKAGLLNLLQQALT